jgi:hypothetical protein
MNGTPKPLTRVVYISEDFRTTIVGETSEGPPVVRYSKIHKNMPTEPRIVHYQSPTMGTMGENSAWVANVFYLLLEVERLNKHMERQMINGDFEQDVYITTYKDIRQRLEILCGKSRES